MLDNPNLRVLADEVTPTTTRGNLGALGNADEIDPDSENYKDISSK